MHGSWGNMIDAEDAFARMGADVMRWQYCAQPPTAEPALRLRAGARDQAEAAHALELGRRLLRPLREHRRLRAACTPTSRPGRPASCARSTAGSSPGRAQLVEEATAGYEAFLTVDVIRAFEAYLDDLSNWYIRRSRRRFWDGDEVALRTLWFGLVQSLRVRRAGDAVPRRAPVAEASCASRPRARRSRSSSPAGPSRGGRRGARRRDRELRRVVALGHQARSSSGLKLRQPLRRLVVEGAPARRGRTPTSCARSCGSRRSSSATVEATELRVKPHLPALGPRLGKELGAVRAALAAGEFEQLDGRRLPGRRARARSRRGARRAVGPRGLGGRVGGRCHRRARDDARRRARARGPRARPDPHAERDAQGAGPRADRPDRRDAARRADAELLARTPTGSRPRCWPSRSRPTASPPRRSRRSSSEPGPLLRRPHGFLRRDRGRRRATGGARRTPARSSS